MIRNLIRFGKNLVKVFLYINSELNLVIPGVLVIFDACFNTKILYIYIYIESLMSCHLLLNLLHELANMI